jgi:hypothetical protein
LQLQVLEHRVSDGETVSLAASPRVLYRVDANEAQYERGECSISGPAHVLTFELVPAASETALMSA